MDRRIRRVFTPEQKFTILKDIKTFPTVKEGLEKYQLCPSIYQKWKRQLAVGVRASLRNSKPLKAPIFAGWKPRIRSLRRSCSINHGLSVRKKKR